MLRKPAVPMLVAAGGQLVGDGALLLDVVARGVVDERHRGVRGQLERFLEFGEGKAALPATTMFW